MQCEDARQEVLSLVSSTLARQFPDQFQLRGDVLQNVVSGEEFDLADQGRNPMDVVARLVQVTPHNNALWLVKVPKRTNVLKTSPENLELPYTISALASLAC